MSYLWYSVIGCLTTFVVGMVVSLITGAQDPEELDHDLLSPPVRLLLNCRRQSGGSKKKNLNGIANLGLDLEDEKSTK